MVDGIFRGRAFAPADSGCFPLLCDMAPFYPAAQTRTLETGGAAPWMRKKPPSLFLIPAMPQGKTYSFSGMRTSRTKPTRNSTAIDSTPIDGLPVSCVKTLTRNVPMTAAYLPKMSKKP